jgi:hypothetical protein
LNVSSEIALKRKNGIKGVRFMTYRPMKKMRNRILIKSICIEKFLQIEVVKE